MSVALRVIRATHYRPSESPWHGYISSSLSKQPIYFRQILDRRYRTISALKLKVLILGAGIPGLCLAYWLARTRLDTSITIIERSPSPRVTGQSIDIRGPAIEIVKGMKLEEGIRASHTTEEGIRFVNSSGETFA